MRIMSLLYVMVGLMMWSFATYAQSPVEKVILKYDNVKGSKDFIAQGGEKLSIAKSLMKKTPVASLVSDVNTVYVLKMGNASQQNRTAFLTDLRTALKTYEYHGRHPSSNGEVEVYVNHSDKGQITELVIYNPGSCTLNLLKGTFPLDALLRLE